MVGVFPSDEAYIRLLTCYLIEYSEDWFSEKSYIKNKAIEELKSRSGVAACERAAASIEWIWGVGRKATRVVGLQRILRSEMVLQTPPEKAHQRESWVKIAMELVMTPRVPAGAS